MKKILYSIFLCGLTITMSAQIKGTVTDSGNIPVKNAKVAIYSLPDSVLIAGTTTNERGEFEFPAYYSVNKATMYRALPEQHVKLRDELTLPDELTVNDALSSVPEKKI